MDARVNFRQSHRVVDNEAVAAVFERLQGWCSDTPLVFSNSRTESLPASLLEVLPQVPLPLTEFRLNADSALEVQVRLGLAFEKCFEGFFRDQHRK